MKEPMVADLARYENQPITGFFCASQKSVRNKKDGAPYLALVLSDRTGQVEAMLWDMSDCSGEFAQGDVVKVRGQVGRYRDKLQLTLSQMRKAETHEYTLADFVPATERDVDQLWQELENWVASFTDADLQRLVRAFLNDAGIGSALREAPAAKSMHHAWIGGLLEHIVSLVGLCDRVASYYPGIHRDLVLTGAMLHDIGKLAELRWGMSFDYTLPGQLLGHITMGVNMVEHKIAELGDFPAEKRVLVEHMILSHHGKYEFGSPKLPMIPEAILLHYLDDLDAKMQTVTNEFARAAASGRDAAEVTEWVRSMERPLLNTRAYLAKAEKQTASKEAAAGEGEMDALPFED
jgi:3'-5' exoribonuclease